MKIVCYSKRGLIVGLVCFLMIIPISATSYVLPASHILDLMTGHIREPRGLEIVQTRSMVPADLPDNPDQAAQQEIEQVEEHLWFRFPGKFRSEIISETRSRILVVSGDEAIL